MNGDCITEKMNINKERRYEELKKGYLGVASSDSFQGIGGSLNYTGVVQFDGCTRVVR
ncbi:13793_t:CDS:2 [Funneliformis mosseae]|uniref:13793_t:CDS:1 n=1 Tax=Funneliformis mosseae TaxID=27381 RepID=A0A9N9EV32_FUNMO|nr:13793_t:CDS:2 [Funneliformis mosseae]